MGRKPVNWHVWCWDGKRFDLVWNDLLMWEAYQLITWRNQRAEAQGSEIRYVATRDGEAPTLEVA